MSDKWGYFLWLIIALAAGLLIGHSWGHKAPESDVVTKTDTLTVFDTIERIKPIYSTITVERTDTVRLVTTERDTVEVEVPIERKVYQEDSLYYAEVSGYRASLNTLEVWPKTVTITTVKTVKAKPSKWSFGAALGPSVLVTPSGSVKAGVGVTAGVAYRF